MGDGRTWVLAMNPTRARILRGLGEPGAAGAAAELVMRAGHRHLLAAMDRAAAEGLTHDADPVAADQRDFVRQVVHLLEAHRLAGDFERLAVFASPALLCELRSQMPARLAATLAAERARSLMHLSEADLARAARSELGASSV
ncbi:baeRF12 domain-containing protein [Rhodovulum strictum]|nr:host attachment protein [Rhodovulum strictum]